MSADLWSELDRRITAARSAEFVHKRRTPVAGGCINECFVVTDDDASFFVKLNRDPQALDMFVAESSGLEALAACDAVRVPEPIIRGEIDGQAFLVLEYLHLSSHGDMQRAGRALATLHRMQGRYYGWRHDYAIGDIRQRNTRCDEWATFWAEHRLGFQLDLAARDGHELLVARGRRLQERVQSFFTHGEPGASLLHGDLWSGNFAFDDTGAPALFDPAVYYGDRETDLALTELFGGFSHDFYAAYDEAWPLAPEYRTRKVLYNLYHVLNHLHLFGGGYLRQASAMIDELLAELG